MRVIKFNIQNIPSYIEEDVIFNDGNQNITGYLLRHSSGDIRVNVGDFIIESSSEPKVISKSLYDSNLDIKEEIQELIGQEYARNVMKLITSLTLTDVQEADLVNRIISVLVILNAGAIQRSRNISNGLVIAGQLTAPRKTALIAEIDKALIIING